MKTNEALAQLKRMATKAGEAIYERAKLAASIMGDTAWIDAEFAGDYDAAEAAVEADCFPELSAAFGLSQLLELIATFPAVEEWRQHKFSLPRLWAEFKAKTSKDKPEVVRRKATVADLEERDEKIKELEWHVKSAHDTMAERERELSASVARLRMESESEIEKLRRENAELRAELAEVRGENKSLLRMIENMRGERKPQYSV